MNSRTSFLSDLNGHRASIADFMMYCKRSELTVSDRVVMLERTLVETGGMQGYNILPTQRMRWKRACIPTNARGTPAFDASLI